MRVQIKPSFPLHTSTLFSLEKPRRPRPPSEDWSVSMGTVVAFPYIAYPLIYDASLPMYLVRWSRNS